MSMINLLYPKLPVRQMLHEFFHCQIVGLRIIAITVDASLDYFDVTSGQEWFTPSLQKLVWEIGDQEISQ